MKSSNSVLILLATVLSVSFLGCSKDTVTSPPPEPPQEDLYLSKVYMDGVLAKEIEYDESKRIRLIQEYVNGQADDFEHWEYNEAGQVYQRWFANADNTLRVVWVYEHDTNGKISKSLVYPNLFGAPTSQTTYEYDIQGRVSTRYSYNTPSDLDKITSYIKYEYDGDGNPTIVKGYRVGQDVPDELYVDMRYEYDDPALAAKSREWIGDLMSEYVVFLFSSRTYTNYAPDGSIIAANTVSFDTEFNAAGLPARSTMNYNSIHPPSGSGTAEVTYEYTTLQYPD